MLTQCTRIAQSAAAVAMLLAAGCIASPTNGDSVPSVNDTFDFMGATLYPGETIEVQALSVFGDSSHWETIAETTTSRSALRHEGTDWYTWSLTTKVPWSDRSDHFWRPTNKPGFNAVCTVRAVGSQSGVLATFEQGFVPLDFLYDDFEDVVDESYHGDDMFLYAEE